MAQTLCEGALFEAPDIPDPSRDQRAGQDEGLAPVPSAWGMGLVTAVTLASFSALAATTAIAWHLTAV